MLFRIRHDEIKQQLKMENQWSRWIGECVRLTTVHSL